MKQTICTGIEEALDRKAAKVEMYSTSRLLAALSDSVVRLNAAFEMLGDTASFGQLLMTGQRASSTTLKHSKLTDYMNELDQGRFTAFVNSNMVAEAIFIERDSVIFAKFKIHEHV